jgi:hypothetical protein
MSEANQMTIKKPDVIYIGFYRAGSAFLRSYFSFHPDIYWTRNAQFFLSNKNDSLLKKEYLDSISIKNNYKCFIDMFEALSTGYIVNKNLSWKDIGYKPNSPINKQDINPNPVEVARKIKKILPKAKILIVLRNQIDWLRSIYLHQILLLPQKNRTFSDFLSTLAGKSALYAGLFHLTIDGYYKFFGRENVLILLLEQIEIEEDECLKELCKFLNVPFVKFPSEKKDFNKGKGDITGEIIKICSALKIPDNIVQSLKPIWNTFIRIIDKLSDRDILSFKEKSFIHCFYSVSNLHTSNLLGADLRKYGYPL